MENSLKQRIIGAIVLAALAIIFLPAILKEKASNGTFESKIPEKPQELEEYRVDTDKIEKLKQAKDLERQQQLSLKEKEADSADTAKQATMPVEQSLASETKNKVRKSKQKVADSTLANKNTEQTGQVSSAKPNSETVKPKQANSKPAKNKSTKAKPTKTRPTPSNSASTKEASQAKTAGAGFKSAAWVVQVASFSNETNAIKLVEKLKQHQFKAYRRKSIADSKTVYRVYVGPFIDKPGAQSKSEAISKVSETKVVLRVFDPVKH